VWCERLSQALQTYHLTLLRLTLLASTEILGTNVC